MCRRCKKQVDGLLESVEELCEEVETVRGFCYLGDRVNITIILNVSVPRQQINS